MFETIDPDPVMQFEIPSGASEARIISTFSGNVSDKQFIFTVRGYGTLIGDDLKFEELSWSSSLNCSFEYVKSTIESGYSTGIVFSLESGVDLLEISCIEWQKSTSEFPVKVTSLALELFSKEWELPDSLNHLLVPGRVV